MRPRLETVQLRQNIPRSRLAPSRNGESHRIESNRPSTVVDCARWTTTLTASYLAITAALIAILGKSVPGRVWLVAVHLTLAGSLLILNRARPSSGILRVIRDWHPLPLFPLLYKEVEVLAAVIGDWRLTAAIPAWESALFAGQPSLYLSERLAFVPLSDTCISATCPT